MYFYCQLYVLVYHKKLCVCINNNKILWQINHSSFQRLLVLMFGVLGCVFVGRGGGGVRKMMSL